MLKAPAPTTVTELKSFLGMVNYYGKFLPNLSTHLAPLYQLLKKESPWIWTEGCASSFAHVKQLLSSPQVLVHYDPELLLKLAGRCIVIWGWGCFVT